MRTSAVMAVLAVLLGASAAQAVTVKRGIAFAEPNGQPLLLDAYLPSGPGPHPAALVIHGGSWRSGSRTQLAAYAWGLARAGIAAFSIDYRLAPAHTWPAQIEDCRAALGWLREHADRFDVDVSRLGAVGYSAGAQLALLLGLDRDADAGNGPGLRAVVAGGAPCDFQRVAPDVTTFAYWLGGTRAERPEAYRTASPFAYVDGEVPPLLLFNGTLDLLVPIRGPERMVARVREVGGEAELIRLGGSGHLTAAIRPRALIAMVRFLRDKLEVGRAASAAPN